MNVPGREDNEARILQHKLHMIPFGDNLTTSRASYVLIQ